MTGEGGRTTGDGGRMTGEGGRLFGAWLLVIGATGRSPRRSPQGSIPLFGAYPDLTGLKAHGDARMQSILGEIFLHRVVVYL